MLGFYSRYVEALLTVCFIIHAVKFNLKPRDLDTYGSIFFAILATIFLVMTIKKEIKVSKQLDIIIRNANDGL